MDTQHIKDEVEKNVERLTSLRDEVKLKLHLATLDAKKEWDERIEPRVNEVEQAAKSITESSRSTLNEVVAKLEEFLARIRDNAPHSSN